MGAKPYPRQITPTQPKLLINKVKIKFGKDGRNRDAINYDHWLYHTRHLYNDIAYSRDCRICHLSILDRRTLGIMSEALWKDIQFYNNAIQSGKRVISIMDRIRSQQNVRTRPTESTE